jgi:hypothetical protein
MPYWSVVLVAGAGTLLYFMISQPSKAGFAVRMQVLARFADARSAGATGPLLHAGLRC